MRTENDSVGDIVRGLNIIAQNARQAGCECVGTGLRSEFHGPMPAFAISHLNLGVGPANVLLEKSKRWMRRPPLPSAAKLQFLFFHSSRVVPQHCLAPPDVRHLGIEA